MKMNKNVGGIIAFLFIMILSSCSRKETDNIPDGLKNNTEYSNANIENFDVETNNLYKLCKFWGFVKYTHESFLLGIKDWDEELLSLVPIIQFTREEDVNDILYEWFIELGDDGYALNWSNYRELLIEKYGSNLMCYELIVAFSHDENTKNWTTLKELNKELYFIFTERELHLREMADISWINDDYLGNELNTVLSLFYEIQTVDREKAPVSFDQMGNSVFTNEKNYSHMDYSNDSCRLLGFFRLWNAIEYYFLYMDIIDDDWDELLLIHIPTILAGTDKLSYELTLASLASKLHDGHINFQVNFRRYSNLHFQFSP